MADTKISALTALDSTADLGQLYIPLFKADGSPDNARILASTMFLCPDVVNITPAWSGTGTATTPLLVNVTADPGPANAASKLANFAIGGNSKASISKDGSASFGDSSLGGLGTVLTLTSQYGTGTLRVGGGGAIVCPTLFYSALGLNVSSDTGFITLGSAGDVVIYRTAADRLALRRTTNAQRFEVYRTWTDATTWERGVMGWYDSASDNGTAGTTFRIGTEKGSVGGTARPMSLITDGVERITLSATASQLTFNGGGALINLNSGGVLRTQFINDASNAVSHFEFSSSGHATFSVGTNAPLFRFAGTTDSFPAFKRSGTELQVKLADDSGFASLATGTLTIDEAKNVVVGTTTGTKIGTATGQKLAFWNATPVVQQVLATGGGATVDNVITLLQTLGLCKQS